ncbi:MAG: M81 family metallopeptidase [Verrucomicrobiales bacterium]|nr:M81 family metallopeptidase [Verrucomicrobiales bacterium]
MPKIFIAGLFHETHTFLDETTGLDDFEIRRGPEIFSCSGDSSPLGGAVEFFSKRREWKLRPGPDYRAVPSGTVEDAVIDSFWNDFVATWNPNVDGIFLVLHGAMVSESIDDVEGEILGRIRSLPNAESLPIFGVFDLHANVSPAMTELANGLVGYRENPHSDAREAAVRAAELMARQMDSGEAVATVNRHTDLVWAPTHTATADDPMRSLEARAREFETANEHVWAVSVSAGFAFADTPDTGVSFQIVTTDPAACDPILDDLITEAKRLDSEITQTDLPVDEVIARIVAEPVEGLTVLVEPSENIGGGAPGDGTGLFRALLNESVISEAAVCLNDPEAVSLLHEKPIGHRQKVALGGKGSRFDEGPVVIEVEVVFKSDGEFELEDKHSHLASLSGDFFDMGDSVVVKTTDERIRILLTSNRTPPFDLGQWRSQRINPEELKFVVVKAAVAHRQGYDPVTARSFTVDTPGPCRSDLSQFTYSKCRGKTGTKSPQSA